MDEQDFRKRNTDCVYFLASPLTCKKGLECEYRHSEMARLNPTDCRYWLDRGCSNLACAFRHPPLEGRTEAEAESADPPYGVTQPVFKKTVACYYFFNYLCKNGDRCQFLHGDDISTHDWIPSKASSGANCVVAAEKKITLGSNSKSTQVKTSPSISGTTLVADTQHKPKMDFQQSAPSNAVSHDKDGLAGKLDSLIPAEDFIQSRSRTVTDQSSEGYFEGLMERKESLESPPGFDVLVGGESKNLGYEDDADYLSEDGENGVDLMGNGYGENGIKYDSEYQELRVQYEEYEEWIHDSCGGLDSISGDSRDKSFNRISSRKRKSMLMEPAFNGHRDFDLRDILKKRRTIDGHGGNNYTRRNESFGPIVQRRERPRWHVYNEFEGVQTGVNHRDKFRRAHINRHHSREKRHARQHSRSYELLSRSAPRERRSTEESSTFTRPKTLDQIKEEKKKAQENGYSSVITSHSVSSRDTSERFQSPKPLDEILRRKRSLLSVVRRSDNRSSKISDIH